jgi:hypothetical protein
VVRLHRDTHGLVRRTPHPERRPEGRVGVQESEQGAEHGCNRLTSLNFICVT